MKIKKIILTALSIFLGIFMIYAGINHILKPEFYSSMIPSFIPDWLAHSFSLIAEVLVGLALIIPKYRKIGALGFVVLMLIFLPIHTWDLLRENHAENPLIPTMKAAVIRFSIQIIVIAIGFWLFKNLENNRNNKILTK